MKLFLSYLKEKRREILICMVFSAVFILSFTLYRLPVRVVIYPFVICLVIFIGVLATDFIRYARRHRELDEMIKMRSFIISEIPESEKLIEEDYGNIIRLLREELSMAQTLSDEKYKEMIDYYTVWAHQIKTPIASMKLTLRNEDSPVHRNLSSQLFRIEQYVEMVLAFLRLDSESGDYVFKTCSLDKMIKSSVKKFASDFIGRKLSLNYEESDIEIVTDEKWFCFVLEQIISNSLKYTREGGIHIYINEKKLYIADTGIGVSKEDVPRVFEKGYTGVNGRKEKSSSGIGLYLCKRVCDNLSVDISLSSQQGIGTTVCLDLGQYEIKAE